MNVFFFLQQALKFYNKYRIKISANGLSDTLTGFVLFTMYSTHFIYGYMASDIW